VWVTIEIKTSSGEKGDITLWNLRVMGWAKNNTMWFTFIVEGKQLIKTHWLIRIGYNSTKSLGSVKRLREMKH